MLPPTVAQKNGNDFLIIFARFVFLSCNTGLRPKAPQISSLGFGDSLLQCQFKVLSNCITESRLQKRVAIPGIRDQTEMQCGIRETLTGYVI